MSLGDGIVGQQPIFLKKRLYENEIPENYVKLMLIYAKNVSLIVSCISFSEDEGRRSSKRVRTLCANTDPVCC